MVVAGSQLTTVPEQYLALSLPLVIIAVPKREHVDAMAVEVLLCITKALSALLGPGDYPRLFLSVCLLF